MITVSGISNYVVTFVCCHSFEVIAVKQVVFGFADWTWRDFGWLRVGFGLTLRITPWLTPLRGITPLRKVSTF
jgi:hypothetical protein